MLSSHTQNKATPFQNFNYSNFLITNHLINKHPFPMARKSSPEYLSPEIVNRGINDSGPHAGSPSFSVKVRRGLPDFLSSVNLKYVKLGYSYLIKHGVYFIGLPFIVGILCGKLTWDVFAFEYSLMSALPLLGSLGLALYALLDLAPRSTYLVDFACYLPPDELKITKEEYIDLAEKSGQFDETAIDFQRRALKTSGLGDETYLPRAVFRPDFERDLRHGREEAAQQMFGAVDNLLSATGIKTKDIRILIVNCGMLNTTPSLSAMVINHYKLSHRIQSFNLGGMGCAASVTAVDLANDLLSAYPGSYALVVSTEVVSFTWYGGSELDMVLPNCFFRVGASAVLLSNRHVDRWRAKYQLKQLVRTHKGTDNKSFRSIQMKEDTQGRQGLSVSKDLIEVGGRALKANITTLGPLVLPVSEQFNFFKSLIFRRQSSTNSRSSSDRHYKPYIPDYKLAFEHVCILATSKKVLDEIQKNLDLTDEYMEASRKTLERFGNTSSSSIWYELAYLEARGMVKSGDRIWQLALGSGLKCNSVVWKAVRNVRKVKENPWVGL